MKDEIIILIVLFIFIGFSWDSLKQEARVSNQSGLFGNASLSDTSSVQTEITEEEAARQIKEIERKAKELEKKITEAEKEKLRSPYYGKVSLSYISYLNDPDPSREYLTLYTNLNAGEKINITGWTLKSARSGNSATIGRASALPYPYTKNDSDVVLQQNHRVYLVKGFSPINISFRTNKCTGYFEQDRTFYPSLSLQCPSPRDEDLPQFSRLLDRDDECRELIERLSRCITPKFRWKDLPDTITSSCKTYIDTQINYNVCVANHLSDTDFPGADWYVYLNRFGPLWRDRRETIKLYDRSGLIVSELSYGF